MIYVFSRGYLSCMQFYCFIHLFVSIINYSLFIFNLFKMSCNVYYFLFLFIMP